MGHYKNYSQIRKWWYGYRKKTIFNGRIKIITGIRRCGKSYLLFELYKNYLLKNSIVENQIIEIALDDIENSQYRDPFKLNEYIKSKITDDKRYYIFIDEIQFSKSVKNPYIDDGYEMFILYFSL